jgi:methylated-DNA-[protein]-cysteine S-methyltransferase
MSADDRKPTEFEQRVYDLLMSVPAGKVTSYGALAKQLGTASPRAVGQALRRNPFAPEVPCHRVISGDLRIGGFSGQTAGPKMAKKRRLLESEGVAFGPDGRLADEGCLWHFGAE